MSPLPRRLALRLGRGVKAIIEIIAGWGAIALFRLFRLTDRKRTAEISAWTMRKVGPWLPEHRTGRANLVAAFPEKSAAEIEQILEGVWDNLGRVAIEFVHLDRMHILDFERPGPADVVYDPVSFERFLEIRGARKATLFFGAHLANWEVPLRASAIYDIDMAVLYRRPNMVRVANAIVKMRAGIASKLIAAGRDAPLRLGRMLEDGTHVGMLVDQHDYFGTDVTFFGRTCKVSPLIARLARLLDCDIRGVRIVRQPDGHHFWGEVTEPLTVPRSADGRVDIDGTMQAITSIVEGWVHEHPEQWLWLHRRWR
jgi:KDO2-lipid IV(A) lauroyltransferase